MAAEGTRAPGPEGQDQDALAQEQCRVWRAVAEERERALEELERINQWLEADNRNREQALTQMQLKVRQLTHQLEEATRTAGPAGPPAARGLGAASGGPVQWLKVLLPRDSRRGRVARRSFRVVARLLKRAV